MVEFIKTSEKSAKASLLRRLENKRHLGLAMFEKEKHSLAVAVEQEREHCHVDLIKPVSQKTWAKNFPSLYKLVKTLLGQKSVLVDKLARNKVLYKI